MPYRGTWSLVGLELCKRKFRSVLKLSRRKFNRYCQDIVNGELRPRKLEATIHQKPSRGKPAQQHVQAWLRWAYDNWAKDFAEVLDLVDRRKEKAKELEVGDNEVEEFGLDCLESDPGNLALTTYTYAFT